MNPAYGRAAQPWVLVAVVALHALALIALASLKPAAQAVGLPRPLMVSLLTPAPQPPAESPKPLPPKPRVTPEPVRKEMPPPAAEPAVPATALSERMVEPTPTPLEPLPAVLPPPAAEPAKPVAAYVPPAPLAIAVPPAPTPIEPALPAPPAPPAPVRTVPPRFDADYLDNPAPVYPPLSRRLGEEGRVLLRVFVNPDGSAAQVEVRESSGFERLDKAARDTVRRWRFVPARQGEDAVGAWVLVPIVFSLRS